MHRYCSERCSEIEWLFRPLHKACQAINGVFYFSLQWVSASSVPGAQGQCSLMKHKHRAALALWCVHGTASVILEEQNGGMIPAHFKRLCEDNFTQLCIFSLMRLVSVWSFKYDKIQFQSRCSGVIGLILPALALGIPMIITTDGKRLQWVYRL